MLARTIACTIALAGCSARAIEIDVGRGDLILLAALDAEGTVLETALLGTDTDALPLPAAERGHLVTWRLPAGSLVDAAGEPIPESSLRFASSQDSDDDSCRRCLASAFEAPQTMFAGDLCPPPSFAGAAVFDIIGDPEDRPDLIESTRTETRLALQGPCAYPRFESEAPLTVTTCPLLPEVAPIASHVSALASDGTVFGVNAGWRWRVDASGRLAIDRLEPPLSGPVSMIASLEGDEPRFFYGSARTPDFVHGFDYHLFDSRMTAIPIRAEELDSYEAAQAVAAGPDSVVLYGYRHFDFTGAVTPEYVGCSVAGDQWNCAVEANSCVTGPLLIGLPNGGAVAVGTSFAYRPNGDDAWRCDASTSAAIPTAQGDVTFGGLTRSGRLDNSVFVCGYDAALSGYVVLRAEVPPLSPGEDPTGRITYSVVDRYFSPCSGFITVPERPGQLIAIFYGRAVAMTATGTTSEVLDPELLVPGFSALSVANMRQAGEWLAIESDFGFVYRRRGSGPLLPVYSPEYRRADVALAPLGDALVWHRGGLEPAIVRRTGDDCASVVVETPSDGEWTVETDQTSGTSIGFPRDLSFLPADRAALMPDGRHLVFGIGFVRSVDFQARRVTQRLIDLYNVRSVIPFPSGRVLVVDANRLWSMAPDGTELGPVPLVFDDPETPDPEPDGFGDEEEQRWDSASGVPGVAWAVGTGRIARIVADEDGELRAEAYWTRRLAATLPERGFRVVHAFAPDDVLVSSADLTAGGYLQLKVWRITSDPECAGDTELGLCRDERFDTIHADGTGPFDAVTHEGGQLTFYFRLGEIARSGGDRTVSPLLFPSNAIEQNGLILIAGWGRLSAAISR